MKQTKREKTRPPFSRGPGRITILDEAGNPLADDDPRVQEWINSVSRLMGRLCAKADLEALRRGKSLPENGLSGEEFAKARLDRFFDSFRTTVHRK